jgi:hypothetical protein
LFNHSWNPNHLLLSALAYIFTMPL